MVDTQPEVAGEINRVTIEALHCSVVVDAETGPFSLLGYITWKCISCGTWRVPGAPFHKSGEKAVFLTACGFGDTSQMCCNCQRNKETIVWHERRLRVHRSGIKLLSPLAKLVDEVSAEVVWDKETHSTEQLKVIMKNSKPSERPNAATSWYAEMACNQCRARAGLRTHEENRQIKIQDMTAMEIEKMQKSGKKGKKKK